MTFGPHRNHGFGLELPHVSLAESHPQGNTTDEGRTWGSVGYGPLVYRQNTGDSTGVPGTIRRVGRELRGSLTAVRGESEVGPTQIEGCGQGTVSGFRRPVKLNLGWTY